MDSSPLVLITYLQYYDSEYPCVYKVLDPVADGVDGVHPTVHGVTGVVLVWGHQYPPVGHRQLQIWQRSTWPKTSCHPHHVIHWLAGVLNSP